MQHMCVWSHLPMISSSWQEKYPYGELIWQTNAPSWGVGLVKNVAYSACGNKKIAHTCLSHFNSQGGSRDWCEVGLPLTSPIPASDNPCLSDWWLQARQHFQTCYRAIFDTVFMLTYCWFVWKERNARIFLAEITNTRAAGGGSRKSL